ncbi:MAG: hydantoinase/oxoprolinase N-terminal domain-containing protein, partial [Vicinamibacteria bacterium]
MANRIFCVEVGGTFTDWVLVENGRVTKNGKVLSTPEEPAAAVMNALRGGVEDPAGLSAVIHGSTVATNAVLERKGAVTGLMTTRGFRDVLQIQRQSKSRLFDLFYRQPDPLVPRDRIVEVSERIGPRGEVWRPLELEDLAQRLGELVEHGTESMAVCLLHSYANPTHELALSRYLEERYPRLYVTLSSEVLPRFREYERMSTCTISAYVKPRVDRYLGELESSLSEAGFEGHLSIVQANGGSIPASEARRHAAKMILSG